MSSGDGPPLRIGLILDGPTLTAVYASIVRDLLQVGLRPGSSASSWPRRGRVEPRSRLPKFRAEGGVAFAVYAMLDRRRAGVVHDPLEPRGPRGLLAGLPTVSPRAGRPPGDLPADVIERGPGRRARRPRPPRLAELRGDVLSGRRLRRLGASSR